MSAAEAARLARVSARLVATCQALVRASAAGLGPDAAAGPDGAATSLDPDDACPGDPAALRLYVLQSELNRAVARSDEAAAALRAARQRLEAAEAEVDGLRRDLADADGELVRWRARAEAAEGLLAGGLLPEGPEAGPRAQPDPAAP
ncbi:hypothetical protein OPKNFCMD_4254 [Methylobacterium crusticola]|uniref:Uncharacterized protein n=1 Tax=Methylobacterium crusticola TaxID=1697972 RepID=A0ABQ4R3S4_9HYPH|nr:hypothetical protein [Methylobacterium crusticola]GJD51499.1 hypothetical protein OPKNFCMD_4254 [Methylobacterium crusticola]